jgi:hypothetical protein
MTTEELIALIELRHKLKREISEDMFNEIKPLNLDPTYELDILDQNTVVKKHTSEYYYNGVDAARAYNVFEQFYTKLGYIFHRHTFDVEISEKFDFFTGRFRFVVWFSNPE